MARGAGASKEMGRRATTADASKVTQDVMKAMASMDTIEEEKFGDGVLDSEMSVIQRRKTISIKADNVSEILM